MCLLIAFTLSAICIGLAAAVPIPHKHHGHNAVHGEVTSYPVVTKPESDHGNGNHVDNKGHQWNHVHHEENHGHGEHRGHRFESHGKPGHAKYEFEYGVKDTKTVDIKDQWESRDGNKVKD